jgi:hypothetical protein
LHRSTMVQVEQWDDNSEGSEQKQGPTWVLESTACWYLRGSQRSLEAWSTWQCNLQPLSTLHHSLQEIHRFVRLTLVPITRQCPGQQKGGRAGEGQQSPQPSNSEGNTPLEWTIQ